MITDATVVFPNNVVNLIAVRVALIDSDLQIFKRPLRNTDPNQSVGIFASQWLPDDTTHEMKASGFHDPTVEQYIIAVQAFVKHMDEEIGLTTHSVLSEMIRSMIYRDAPLMVGLSALTTTLNGVQKRYRKSGIRTQRYFSNELSGSWLYLSTLEFWLETETT